MSGGLRVHAFAKINITLRVLGQRPGGYHELRTIFQTIALRDTLLVSPTDRPFTLVCTDPDCPGDERNLVWRAADAVWRASGRRGPMRGAAVRLTKRIPVAAGLGGGSSDAAAALRAFDIVWRTRLPRPRLQELAASLGADVPYFLEGGTMLGVERGDVLFALDDLPPVWVVLVLPSFGVSTGDAFGWYDAVGPAASVRQRSPTRSRATVAGLQAIPASELRNDLQAPVAAHHPDIGRIVRRLSSTGAYAAMSGSGSAVFGLFSSRVTAARAAAGAGGRARRVVLTRTLTRAEFESGSAGVRQSPSRSK